MADDMVFKGAGGEFQLILNDVTNFDVVLEQLRIKLPLASEFFCCGTTVRLPAKLTAEQRTKITELLAEHGLVNADDDQVNSQPLDEHERHERHETKALIVSKTLRSGQKVTYEGSVVVVGDVNPGAEVIAGEDIIILGSCRGVAHAGVAGNVSATITANKIIATQLRIAGLIARAPDGMDKPAYVETARIKDGIVIIEPAN